MNRAMLDVGTPAPPFSGRDQHGREIRSAELLARGPLVLYFYPRDFTPGCTREACLFRDAFEDLQALGATIVGVSADSEGSHKRFAAIHNIPFSLLADEDRALARAYDVLRPFGLGARRVTYVIGQDGRIRGVFHSELSMSRHVAEARAVLQKLRNLSSPQASGGARDSGAAHPDSKASERK
jgi:peroxiredoxin Q/BCP